MTSDLEKQFFDTFGIEPREYCERIYQDRCFKNCPLYPVRKTDECFKYIEAYPEISDHILLELICVYNRYDSPFISGASKIENLKKHILNSLIITFECENTDEFKHQVQALFKE